MSCHEDTRGNATPRPCSLRAHRPVPHLPTSRLSSLWVFNWLSVSSLLQIILISIPWTLFDPPEPFLTPRERASSSCPAGQNWLCPSQVLPWFVLSIRHSSITLGTGWDLAWGLFPFLPGGDTRIFSKELSPLTVLKHLKKLKHFHSKPGDAP